MRLLCWSTAELEPEEETFQRLAGLMSKLSTKSASVLREDVEDVLAETGRVPVGEKEEEGDWLVKRVVRGEQPERRKIPAKRTKRIFLLSNPKTSALENFVLMQGCK